MTRFSINIEKVGYSIYSFHDEKHKHYENYKPQVFRNVDIDCRPVFKVAFCIGHYSNNIIITLYFFLILQFL